MWRMDWPTTLHTIGKSSWCHFICKSHRVRCVDAVVTRYCYHISESDHHSHHSHPLACRSKYRTIRFRITSFHSSLEKCWTLHVRTLASRLVCEIVYDVLGRIFVIMSAIAYPLGHEAKVYFVCSKISLMEVIKTRLNVIVWSIFHVQRLWNSKYIPYVTILAAVLHDNSPIFPFSSYKYFRGQKINFIPNQRRSLYSKKTRTHANDLSPSVRHEEGKSIKCCVHFDGTHSCVWLSLYLTAVWSMIFLIGRHSVHHAEHTESRFFPSPFVECHFRSNQSVSRFRSRQPVFVSSQRKKLTFQIVLINSSRFQVYMLILRVVFCESAGTEDVEDTYVAWMYGVMVLRAARVYRFLIWIAVQKR